jgi:hypothetical protein
MALPISPRDFVVLSFERPEGERFAIFRHNEWLQSASPSQWGSPATAIAAMEQFVQSLELLTEETLLTRLQGMGIAIDAAASYVSRSRNISRMNQGVIWERVTEVGYRNEEGQEVVAKTTRTGGEPEQHVFMMRCSVCGHEYGTYGAEIPHRRCPHCQDGAPGVPI